MTDLLTEDILKSDVIDLKSILDKFDSIEYGIMESLQSGSIEFTLPKNLEIISNYKDPASLETVRGAIIWNELEPNNQINPPDKINLIKLKPGLRPDSPEMIEFSKKYPDKYGAVLRVCYNPEATINISRFGFDVVALPKAVEVIPEYLMDLIDYNQMVNYNISNGYILLESLSIFISETTDTTKYKSNIVEV